MKLFSSLLINQTLALAQVFFLSALINCLAIFSVIYLLAVYERVIPTSSEDSLITLTILAILAVVIELTIRFIRSEIVERIISRFCATIQLMPKPANKLSLATPKGFSFKGIRNKSCTQGIVTSDDTSIFW